MVGRVCVRYLFVICWAGGLIILICWVGGVIVYTGVCIAGRLWRKVCECVMHLLGCLLLVSCFVEWYWFWVCQLSIWQRILFLAVVCKGADCKRRAPFFWLILWGVASWLVGEGLERHTMATVCGGLGDGTGLCLHSHDLFLFGWKFFVCCERAFSICGGRRGLRTTVVVRQCGREGLNWDI